jgi:F0F1-type ATP synthase assembly protein I
VDEKDRDPSSPSSSSGSRLQADVKRLAEDRFAAARTFASVGTVGLSFVFAIVIGSALGLWLDRLTGWSPWLFLLFFVIGLVAGIMNVYRTLTDLPK